MVIEQNKYALIVLLKIKIHLFIFYNFVPFINHVRITNVNTLFNQQITYYLFMLLFIYYCLLIFVLLIKQFCDDLYIKTYLCKVDTYLI